MGIIVSLAFIFSFAVHMIFDLKFFSYFDTKSQVRLDPQLANNPKSTTGPQIVFVRRNSWKTKKCEGYGVNTCPSCYNSNCCISCFSVISYEGRGCFMSMFCGLLFFLLPVLNSSSAVKAACYFSHVSEALWASIRYRAIWFSSPYVLRILPSDFERFLLSQKWEFMLYLDAYRILYKAFSMLAGWINVLHANGLVLLCPSCIIFRVVSLNMYCGIRSSQLLTFVQRLLMPPEERHFIFLISGCKQILSSGFFPFFLHCRVE